MSTEYLIHESSTKRFKLNVDEHSSLLDLSLYDRNTDHHFVLAKDCGPHEMAKIGLTILKTASYVDGDLSEALKGQDKYIIDELKRALK